MELRLAVPGDADDLRSLREWLGNEADVRNYAKISTSLTPIADGEMGLDLEALKLIFETGFNIASLVMSVASWRETRHVKPTVEFHDSRRTVILSSSSEEAIESAIRELDGNGSSSHS
jgi:hypothetical protein